MSDIFLVLNVMQPVVAVLVCYFLKEQVLSAVVIELLIVFKKVLGQNSKK